MPRGGVDPPLGKASAVVMVLKASIGTGLLELPYANSKVGLALGMPASCVIGALTALGVWRLVETKVIVERQGVALRDFGLGPAAAVAHATTGLPGALLAGLAIIAAQLGCCVCYVDVLLETIGRLLDISRANVRCVLFPLVASLCLVRQLKDIAVLSFIALAVYVYVVFILVKWGVREIVSDEFDDDGRFDIHWSGSAILFGSTVFAFEGVNVIQFVYDAMQLDDPAPFLQVLVVSNVICCGMFVFVGSFGFYVYGNDIKELVYLNFPEESPDVEGVQWILCCVTLLTFVLQMYPVFSCAESLFGLSDSIEQADVGELLTCEYDMIAPIDEGGELPEHLMTRWTPPSHRTHCELYEDQASEDESSLSSEEERFEGHNALLGRLSPLALRFTIVLTTFFLSELGADIATVMNANGTFSLGLIGFILPPVFHWKAFGRSIPIVQHVGNAILLCTGISSWCIGIYRFFLA